MILETILSIFSVAEKGAKLYDWFSGTGIGKTAKENLELASKRKEDIIKLSDRVFIAPNFTEAVNLSGSSVMTDMREMRSILDPLANRLNSDIFSSQVGSTPLKLRQAFAADPWAVLMNIKPADRVRTVSDADQIPILFMDDGRPYVGWQMRGALPMLFDCDFNSQSANLINKTINIHQNRELYFGGIVANSAVENYILNKSLLLNKKHSDVSVFNPPNIPLEKFFRYLPSNSDFSQNNMISIVEYKSDINGISFIIFYKFEMVILNTHGFFYAIEYKDFRFANTTKTKFEPSLLKFNNYILKGIYAYYFEDFFIDMQLEISKHL